MKLMNKILIGISVFLLMSGIYTVNIYNKSKTYMSYENIEIKNDGKYISWKYKNSEDWTNLVSIKTLTGNSDKEIEIELKDSFIKWRYAGDSEWENLVDVNKLVIQNENNDQTSEIEKEIELSKNEEYVVYRYKGENNWENLIKISELKGNDGTNGIDGKDGVDGKKGKEIELDNSNGFIKWRYVGDTSWINIIDINTLKGKDGIVWVNLGSIENIHENFCNPDNELECNHEWYMKLNLLDEGNYVFNDGDDSDLYTWHVKTEKTENRVLIEYWSTDKIYPTYISGMYANNKWTFTSIEYVAAEEFNDVILDIHSILDENSWKNLGTIDVSTYCDPNNSEDCGYKWYITKELIDTGKYVFIENYDNFEIHVKTERSENNVLISYWTTEETLPYELRGYYDTNNKKWEFNEYSYLS